MTLLLEIGLGEGTSLEFSESTAWIADLPEAVKGISRADPVSLEANNLVCLTRRLSRLEVLDSGLTFLKIMTELQFAAKINSILHHKCLCQKESGQVQKASLRPVLGKLIRDEKLKLSSLLRWYSAGSRWGRLASGGTVYLLMVIARKPSIASKLKGKRVTSTTIVELSNMLRYPQTPEIQDILRDCLVPLLIKVAQTVPLEIPTLFYKKVLKYFKLSKTLDVRNLSESDQYFDLFFQHTTMALPWLNSFWQDFREVTLSEEPTIMFSLCPLTSSYLGGSQISYESDLENEKDNLGNQSDLPIFVDNFTTQEKVDIVFSTFSYAKSAKGKKKYPFTKNNRQTWTEEMRQKAEEGTVVKTLDELAQGMRNRFYDDKEVSGKPGCLKNSQKWLRVSNELIQGREMKVLDSDNKLIFYSNGTLSPAECKRLLVSLTTFFHTQPAGLSLIQRDKNKPGRNMFSTFHFSTWGRYGQNGHGAPPKVHPTFLRQANGSKTNTSQFFMRSSHDLQVHSEEYDLKNARTTRSSTSSITSGKVTTRSSRSSAVAPKPAVKPAVKKATKATVKRISTPVPLGPRAAEYVKAQERRAAEDKRKKEIRDRVKAVKASEEAESSEEEDRATSPPATSDVDEEEYHRVYSSLPEEGDFQEDSPEDIQEDVVLLLEEEFDLGDALEEVTEENALQEMEIETADNGIHIANSETTPPASSPFSSPKRTSVQAAFARNKLRQQLNISPTKSTSSKKRSPEKRKVYKVTSNMFTPKTRKLAEAAKHHTRRVSTIEEAFPMDKHSFFLDVARSTATAESLVEMGYARGGLFTSLAKKAREFTASYYTLPGTRKSSEVKEIVTWLLTDGHFKYGGVNIETQTFDHQKPFEADGIAHLLRLEYFATKGGANIAVFKEMISAKRIKAPTVALMITVLEHALMEYSEGTYRNSEFTDSAKSRYHYHLASYNCVAQAAPTWADRFEMNLFNLVLNQSNKTFLLDVEADDMKEVDLASLEANAVAAGAFTNL
ncbi:hypothetical protein C8R42DRAFT_723319 [Lentinula raphanica]|nr:hypothetical protein C8R42DRAFT_723319 [Lentinula raphanica]